MTPNGQIAIPLDMAAIREPFLENFNEVQFVWWRPRAFSLYVVMQSDPRVSAPCCSTNFAANQYGRPQAVLSRFD